MDKLVKFFKNPGEILGKLFDTASNNIGFLLISILVVAVILGLAYGSEFYFSKKAGVARNSEKLRVKRMALIALLAALAFILNMFSFPLGFLPSFYKIDASELPVLIGAFTLGPVAGVVIEFIKIILNLLIGGTSTAFVGEFANFVIGCAFIVPAAIIYYAKKTKKNAIIGVITGTIVCIIAGCMLNAFLLLPAYAKALDMRLEQIIGMGTEKNSAITSMSTFVLLAVAPFNLIKCGGVSVITVLIYKKISHLLKGNDIKNTAA
ncbi:MAG: ECF transporter S component [Lachnospiraceae bacterium]|nr:ECF transporter S component [Lachnospiraceae bacterium]